MGTRSEHFRIAEHRVYGQDLHDRIAVYPPFLHEHSATNRATNRARSESFRLWFAPRLCQSLSLETCLRWRGVCYYLCRESVHWSAVLDAPTGPAHARWGEANKISEIDKSSRGSKI